MAAGPARPAAAVMAIVAAPNTRHTRVTVRAKRRWSAVAFRRVRFGRIDPATPEKTKTGTRTSIVAAKTTAAALVASGPPPAITSSGAPLTSSWSEPAITAAGPANFRAAR